MDIALIGIEKLEIFLLVLTRTSGIFTLNPTLGSSEVPMYARLATAVGISFVFVPMIHIAGPLPGDILGFGLLIMREALIGLSIGFLCSMVFSTIEISGQFIDSQSGFSFSTMVDPVNGTNSAVAARFQNLIAMVLFFAVNAHHVLIRGMADSFAVAPIGQVTLNSAAAGGVVDLFTALFVVAIRISIPIVAACFLADLALAVTSRVVPQMNVFMVGMPMKLGIAVTGLMVALPVTMAMDKHLFGDLYHHTITLVRLLGR